MSTTSLPLAPPAVTPVSSAPAPLIIAPASNLSADEKRALLFDVDQTLEISVEDFNDNWWPLVSNIWTKWDLYKYANGNIRKTFACRFMKHRESSTRQKENIPNEKRRITKIRPSDICSAMIKVFWITSSNVVRVERYKDSPGHTHSLLEIDRIKRPKAIRSLVEIEAAKNYSPPAITSAVKEYATVELGLGECARELKRKEVANIKYKVRGPAETHLIGHMDLRSDISESTSYLTEQGYLVETFRVSQRSTKGIVFAHPEQLKKLERHGWLTLMDSTHKTNRHDWRLFTLYVRDTYGCWNPGAHFLVSSEDGDTVAEALTIIRNKYCCWSPRYILSDHSNIEARSIKKTFPGITAGEQECQVLLCVVHVMRTWMQKIHEKKTCETMIAAMHKRTKIGCDSLIQDAINHCSVPSIQNYIKRNYMKNTEKWSLWARQHSPLLLQVTSTNPIESFHSELKKTTSSLHGLIGA
jgi:hypothetical protein